MYSGREERYLTGLSRHNIFVEVSRWAESFEWHILLGTDVPVRSEARHESTVRSPLFVSGMCCQLKTKSVPLGERERDDTDRHRVVCRVRRKYPPSSLIGIQPWDVHDGSADNSIAVRGFRVPLVRALKILEVSRVAWGMTRDMENIFWSQAIAQSLRADEWFAEIWNTFLEISYITKPHSSLSKLCIFTLWFAVTLSCPLKNAKCYSFPVRRQSFCGPDGRASTSWIFFGKLKLR